MEGAFLEALLGSDAPPAPSTLPVGLPTADEGTPWAVEREDLLHQVADLTMQVTTLEGLLRDATTEREQLRETVATERHRAAALEMQLKTRPDPDEAAALRAERDRLQQQLALAKRIRGTRRALKIADPYQGTVADVIDTVVRASNVQLAEESLRVIETIQRDCEEWVGQAPPLFEVINLAVLWLGVSMTRRNSTAVQAALAPYRGRLKPRSLGPVLRVLWQHLLSGE
jgi:hypothetical protein